MTHLHHYYSQIKDNRAWGLCYLARARLARLLESKLWYRNTTLLLTPLCVRFRVVKTLALYRFDCQGNTFVLTPSPTRRSSPVRPSEIHNRHTELTSLPHLSLLILAVYPGNHNNGCGFNWSLHVSESNDINNISILLLKIYKIKFGFGSLSSWKQQSYVKASI